VSLQRPEINLQDLKVLQDLRTHLKDQKDRKDLKDYV